MQILSMLEGRRACDGGGGRASNRGGGFGDDNGGANVIAVERFTTELIGTLKVIEGEGRSMTKRHRAKKLLRRVITVEVLCSS